MILSKGVRKMDKPIEQELCDNCKYRGTFEGREHDVDDWKCNKCGYPCTWVIQCELQEHKDDD